MLHRFLKNINLMMAPREITIIGLETNMNRVKMVLKDLKERVQNEEGVLKTLNSKIQSSYEYVKPESEDLKGKRNVLLTVKKNKNKTADAFKILEEMQSLLDKFNDFRRDTRHATNCLRSYQKILQGHEKEYNHCEMVYKLNISSGSEKYGVVHKSMIHMVALSLPTFKWELQNWKYRAQDLLDEYNSLLLNTRFDELMEKFDKLLQNS